METDSFIQKDVQKTPLCSFNVLITALTHLKYTISLFVV